MFGMSSSRAGGRAVLLEGSFSERDKKVLVLLFSEFGGAAAEEADSTEFSFE